MKSIFCLILALPFVATAAPKRDTPYQQKKKVVKTILECVRTISTNHIGGEKSVMYVADVLNATKSNKSSTSQLKHIKKQCNEYLKNNQPDLSISKDAISNLINDIDSTIYSNTALEYLFAPRANCTVFGVKGKYAIFVGGGVKVTAGNCTTTNGYSFTVFAPGLDLSVGGGWAVMGYYKEYDRAITGGELPELLPTQDYIDNFVTTIAYGLAFEGKAEDLNSGDIDDDEFTFAIGAGIAFMIGYEFEKVVRVSIPSDNFSKLNEVLDLY